MFARTEGYAGNVQQIYAGAITQLTELAIAFKPKEGETFSFDANEKMKGKATNILRTMNAKVYGAIQGGVKAEWTQSNIKNDKLVAAIFGKDAFEKNHFARYFDRNEKAMNAFMDRSKKEGGLGLSQKVWNYTGQLKAELEVALDLGIGEGGSAAHISKAVRSYLNEPDKLFKRVQITTKDAEGNITKTGRYKLSKAAQAYHPGQGVYRSSYKNAMRLTRTETNMAYLTADHERWQQFDFVVGYEVKLSSNHPVTDICNDFAGKYPKTFKFVGWHVMCRCFVIAILCTEKELDSLSDALLNGEELKDFKSINEVTGVPDGFTGWIEANKKRAATAKSIPYFIRDNFVEGDITKGLSLIRPIVDPIKEGTKIIEFIPSKTIQEIEQRYKNAGFTRVDLGRATIEQANIILEPIEFEAKRGLLEIAEIRLQNGIVSSGRSVNGITAAQYWQADLAKDRMLKINLDAFKINTYQPLKSFETEISLRESRINGLNQSIKNYEDRLGQSAMKDKIYKKDIRIAKNQISNYEYEISKLNKQIENGEFPIPQNVSSLLKDKASQVKADVTHELGHYYDNISEATGKGLYKDYIKEISVYGASDKQEYFAEWFVQYRLHGSKGVPEDLLKIFKKF